jgi:hypothetical protein
MQNFFSDAEYPLQKWFSTPGFHQVTSKDFSTKLTIFSEHSSCSLDIYAFFVSIGLHLPSLHMGQYLPPKTLQINEDS